MLRWLIWWVVLFGLWLVLVDTVNPQYLLGGALVAAIPATAARVVAAQRVVRLAVDPSLLRHAWRPLVRAVPDTALLVVALWRRLVLRRPVEGAFRQLRFATDREDPHGTSRRVLAKSLGSFAPNIYVIGFDEENDVLLAHQLVRSGGPSHLDPLELR